MRVLSVAAIMIAALYCASAYALPAKKKIVPAKKQSRAEPARAANTQAGDAQFYLKCGGTAFNLPGPPNYVTTGHYRDDAVPVTPGMRSVCAHSAKGLAHGGIGFRGF